MIADMHYAFATRKKKVSSEIRTSPFAMYSFCDGTLSLFPPISLFNFTKFGNYLETKLAIDASYQNVMGVGVSFRASLVTYFFKMEREKIISILKEAHKFWEAMEMDLFIVVCRCCAAVAHVPGAKFIHLMEKCACPTSVPIYKMCKRKDASNRILVLRNTALLFSVGQLLGQMVARSSPQSIFLQAMQYYISLQRVKF